MTPPSPSDLAFGVRLRRSCLAVPGSNDRMLRKAADLSADQVFLDLEDSVAPDEKNDTTRLRVAAALTSHTWAAKTKVVRINAVGTPWCLDDLTTVVGAAGDALDCIMLPKVEGIDQIHFVDHVLAHLEQSLGLERRIGLEIQIESPRGLVEIERLATASPRIEALIFGPGDYAAAAGMPQLSVGAIDQTYPGDQWHYVLSRIVTTAHAFGLQAIDGPYAAIRDLKGYAEVARRSRALGFDGKWALHPGQIEPCNEIYSPTRAEYERAERILDAYSNAVRVDKVGAVLFDGEMVDEASRKMALQIAARGRAVGLHRELAS
jgi:citrate lyase subunit beta / citryl-CoA lyase